MERLTCASQMRAAVMFAAAAVLFVSLAASWSPSPALANDTALGGIAGDYYPLESTDIRMHAETVQAICYRHFAEYRIDFLFVNSGPAQTLKLGFPYAVALEGDSRGGLIAFRAWQDGKPLAVSVGQGADSSEEYYLHEATFPNGTTMISVSYLAMPTVSSGERYPELMPAGFAAIPGITGWDASYNYWLHTGAGWADTIGTAVVRFELADDFRGFAMDLKSAQAPVEQREYARVTRPETYTMPDDRTFQWTFKELEPTEADDINLAFSWLFMWDEPASIPAVMGAVVKTVASSNPPVTTTDSFDHEAWALLDGSPGTALGLQGQDPWIKLGIQGDTKIQEIRIVPGNNEGIGTYAEYGRPKTVKITLSDGTSSTVTLADEPSVQKFPLAGTADWARLDVIDSYPGSKSPDVYIADVSFGDQPAPSFEAFDSLMAAAGTVIPGSATPSSTVGPPSTGAGGSPATSLLPDGSGAPSGTAGDPAADKGRAVVFTTWPIVLYAVAGAALVAALTMAVILVRRRTKPA